MLTPDDTPLPLSGGRLDRCDEYRSDDVWLRKQFADAQHWLLTADGRVLVDPERDGPLLIDTETLQRRIAATIDDAVLLGCDVEGRCQFAVQLPADIPAHSAGPPATATPATITLRDAAARWPVWESAAFAHAAGLFAWRARQHYCGQCGAPMRSARAGHSRRCTSSNGCAEQFPRTDPAIIVLVEHDDRCLLGRQASWPEGMYSSLAGFVEPGESLEEAVAREVREESGVVVAESRYLGSQPWPFPHSIMIGFQATASDPGIHLGDELEDARWFSPAELQAGFNSGELRGPTRMSISYRLLQVWLRRQQAHGALDALHRRGR